MRVRRAVAVTRCDVLLLVTATVAMCAYQGLFFVALDKAGVAVGTVVAMGAVPMFSGVLALIVGHDRPGRKWCASTAFAIAGCAVLALQSGPVDGVDGVGLLLALGAAASYAAFTLASSRVIARGVESNLAMAVVFGCSATVMLPLLLLTSPSWVISTSGFLVTLYVAAIATVGEYVLYGRGLRSTPVHVVSTLTLVEPAAATAFGVVLLDESVSLASMGGIAMVCAAVGMLTGATGRQARQHDGRSSDYVLDPAA